MRRTVEVYACLRFSAYVVNVNEMRYTLAEGATGAFFDADVTIANPSGVDTQIMVDFLPENGTPVHVDTLVAVSTPLQVDVEPYVPAAAVSTVVRSRHAPLSVERTMIWDASGYGGHGGTSVAPANRWPAKSRVTVDSGTIPQLADRSLAST